MISVRIAICDDDALCREELRRYIREYLDRNASPISLTVFDNGIDLLEEAERLGGFDVYVLDVLMPRLNGIDLGLRLRQRDMNCKILYLTSSPDYALPAFKAKASDYLLKPVKKAELFAALDEVLATLSERQSKSLVIKTRDNSVKVTFDSIQYAQLDGKTVCYHLVSGKIIESTTIRTGFGEAVQEILRDSRFFMCSTSLVVNLYHIHTVDNDMLVFHNGHKLYLSRRASRELRSIWSNFWFNEEGSK